MNTGQGTYDELTGAHLADLLARKEASSLELVELSLARAERFDTRLGLFITRLDDRARAWAREADRLRREGDPRPLLGIPFAVKDLHPMAGVPLTMGSVAFPAMTPPVDSGSIALLRAAGLIVVGTTNACELGPACYTRTAAAGDARNPWDESMSASGSSGGSAAAVAARVVPWAHASDGAGSIRLPASVCGLVGHKPSRGVTPAASASFLPFGVEGAVTRTAADARTLFEVLARPGGADLFPRGARPAARGPLRVAVSGCGPEVDADCRKAVGEAATLLESLGHQLVERAYPLAESELQVMAGCLLDVMSVGAAAAVDTGVAPDREALLQPYTRFLVERGRKIGGTRFLTSETTLARLASGALAAQTDIDVVLSPMVTRPQVAVDRFWLDQGSGTFEAMLGWARFGPLANITGQPAISIPLALTSVGMPIGVQLLGQPGADRTLLGLAADLELARPWAGRHPVMLDAAASPQRLAQPVGVGG